MMFSEIGEAEDKVFLLRWDQIRAFQANDMETNRDMTETQQQAGIFGKDAYIAYFNESPPDILFNVQLDDDTLDDQLEVPEKRNSNPGSVSSQQVNQRVRKHASNTVSFESVAIGSKKDDGKKSLLSKAFDAGEVARISEAPVIVYFPGAIKQVIHVGASATTLDLIKASVEFDKKRAEGPLLTAHDPRRFELRIHDEDGLPDEDLPALDVTSEVSNFGGEVCLCMIEGELPPQDEAATDSEDEDTESDEKEDATQRRGLPAGKAYIDVRYLGGRTKVLPTPGTTLLDVFKKIHDKNKFPLYSEEYQFVHEDESKVSSKIDDYMNLSHLDIEVIPLDTDLSHLVANGITIISLVKRKYADDCGNDSKEVDIPSSAGQNTQFLKNDVAIVDPDRIFFNDLTAFIYEEWNVVKTNKRQKEQNRVFGIDQKRIYNRKQIHAKGMISNVKRSARRIEDVIDFGPDREDPTSFYITFRGAESRVDDTTLKYTIKSGLFCDTHGKHHAVAHILAKLQYIKNSQVS